MLLRLSLEVVSAIITDVFLIVAVVLLLALVHVITEILQELSEVCSEPVVSPDVRFKRLWISTSACLDTLREFAHEIGVIYDLVPDGCWIALFLAWPRARP